MVLESNRTDPPTSSDRVVLVPFTVDPLNLNSPPVMGVVIEIGAPLRFPKYRYDVTVQASKLVEWRQDWFEKDKEIELFVDNQLVLTLPFSSAETPVLVPSSGVVLIPDSGSYGVVGVVSGRQQAYKRVHKNNGATAQPMVDEKAGVFYWPTSRGIFQLSACPNGCRTLEDIDAWNASYHLVASASNTKILGFVTNAPSAALPLAADECEKIALEQCACAPRCRTCRKQGAK